MNMCIASLQLAILLALVPAASLVIWLVMLELWVRHTQGSSSSRQQQSRAAKVTCAVYDQVCAVLRLSLGSQACRCKLQDAAVVARLDRLDRACAGLASAAKQHEFVV